MTSSLFAGTCAVFLTTSWAQQDENSPEIYSKKIGATYNFRFGQGQIIHPGTWPRKASFHSAGSLPPRCQWRTLSSQNGRFEEVTQKGGPGILENAPARACAVGDYDNDGDIDLAVNCVNTIPQLLRCDSTLKRNWIKIKLADVKTNRSDIGSCVTVTAKTKRTRLTVDPNR